MIVCDNCGSANDVAEVALTLRKKGESGRESELSRTMIHVCKGCEGACIKRANAFLMSAPVPVAAVGSGKGPSER